MTYLGCGVNEYGTEISLYICDTCGERFSVCPAVPEERKDEWNGCQAEWCGSYEPMRDADLYFGLGMVESDG